MMNVEWTQAVARQDKMTVRPPLYALGVIVDRLRQFADVMVQVRHQILNVSRMIPF